MRLFLQQEKRGHDTEITWFSSQTMGVKPEFSLFLFLSQGGERGRPVRGRLRRQPRNLFILEVVLDSESPSKDADFPAT